MKCSGSQSVRIKKFKLFQFHDATQNGLMCISRKGPWVLTLLAVPSPTTPLGVAALHSKLSLRLGMVTHAKRSVYIIHFKSIASLSHLDFGTSPSIQLCPDLTTCRTETQGFFILAQLRDNHYFQSCRIAYQVSWVLYNNTVYHPYHVFTAASLFETEIYNLQYYCPAIVCMSVERRCRGRRGLSDGRQPDGRWPPPPPCTRMQLNGREAHVGRVHRPPQGFLRAYFESRLRFWLRPTKFTDVVYALAFSLFILIYS